MVVPSLTLKISHKKKSAMISAKAASNIEQFIRNSRIEFALAPPQTKALADFAAVQTAMVIARCMTSSARGQ